VLQPPLTTRSNLLCDFGLQEYRRDPTKGQSGSAMQSAACSVAAEVIGDGEDESTAAAVAGQKQTGKRKKSAKGPNKRQKSSMDDIKAHKEAAAAAAVVAGRGTSGTLAERQKVSNRRSCTLLPGALGQRSSRQCSAGQLNITAHP
jgi:hypothetical protein